MAVRWRGCGACGRWLWLVPACLLGVASARPVSAARLSCRGGRPACLPPRTSSAVSHEDKSNTFFLMPRLPLPSRSSLSLRLPHSHLPIQHYLHFPFIHNSLQCTPVPHPPFSQYKYIPLPLTPFYHPYYTSWYPLNQRPLTPFSPALPCTQ